MKTKDVNTKIQDNDTLHILTQYQAKRIILLS